MPLCPAGGVREEPLTGEGFAARIDVSRETLDRLRLHLDLLQHWQRRINLVGRATLADPWRRHMLDSAQLLPLLPPSCASLVDLGSGAGFPGLVLAACGARGIHLIESDGRKARFLMEVARRSELDVEVHACRIEAIAGWPADVVTARALAPLPRLLCLAERFLAPESQCLFLKGANVRSELIDAARSWHMKVEVFTSLSDPSGAVLKLGGARRAPDRQP
jgi:16S rRNA (guanine527-N7)-methyltransferase